ncbi:head GIN domain-containing protein [Sphingosinicella sp. YJ22]|uniref:head GIN domain-containing protein n=1 Tax=Sphingosinicella sp. YJ22 TaxID=1104780 RepID=UPI001408E4FE|nr:head GIN domain-containing protein [Sphingosinicella sp. YJ22]
MRAILAALAGAAVLAACNVTGTDARVIEASGVQGARDFQVGQFETVELAGSHNVIVTVGGAPSVRAEGDTAALERLDIRVEGGRLHIGTQRGTTFRGPGLVTVHVTTPSLRGAEIAGSGDMQVSALQAERFEGGIAGSGNLILQQIEAQAAEFEIAGSGNVRASGRVREAKIEVMGSGNAELPGLQAQDAEVSIAGSGNANMHASGTARVSIMGSGNVTVAGGARCDVRKMGSGEVRCG